MCYSAMVRQNLKSLRIKFSARIQNDLFDDLYERRAKGERIKLPRAMDYNFLKDDAKSSLKIAKYIERYVEETKKSLEEDLFASKKRLADAERKLKSKPTKSAEKEKGIAERRIEACKRRLEKLSATKEQPSDSRIYAMDYAPVIVVQNGERVIMPMRYLLRPANFPESFDRDYSGAYNARRDSLNKFWKKLYHKNHGLLVISSFFENVKKHDFEGRKLKKGEDPESMVIEFKPLGMDEMLVPCIWDKWTGRGEPDLYSFALLTDEPPKEVSEAGHDRCPIFLKEENLEKWLNPAKLFKDELTRILDDKETPFYESAAVA